MQIGGFQTLSLIDYPGKVAAVIFTQGCNFRCPFCHNRELVLPAYFKEPLGEEEIFSSLDKRRDKLQGVVITGGEPTLQKDIMPFLTKIKQLGYSIKIDTNGSQPQVLENIIKDRLVDYIAMDIKAPLDKYSALAGAEINAEKIRASIDIIMSSGIEYLFRTTVVKPLLARADIQQIAAMLGEAQKYVLQEFVPCETVLDNTLLDKGHYTEQEFKELQEAFDKESVIV